MNHRPSASAGWEAAKSAAYVSTLRGTGSAVKEHLAGLLERANKPSGATDAATLARSGGCERDDNPSLPKYPATGWSLVCPASGRWPRQG
jgi:hypothetical protein